MSSFLNTDLGALYDNWQQRVAFNEGFAREKITSARSAGAEAFSLGVDRVEARNLYFENRAGLVSDAQSAMAGEGVDDVGEVDDLGEVDDVGIVDDMGEVDDLGEVDANASFDIDEYAMAGDVLSDGALDYYAVHGGNLRDVVDMEETWSEAHDMNFAQEYS